MNPNPRGREDETARRSPRWLARRPRPRARAMPPPRPRRSWSRQGARAGRAPSPRLPCQFRRLRRLRGLERGLHPRRAPALPCAPLPPRPARPRTRPRPGERRGLGNLRPALPEPEPEPEPRPCPGRDGGWRRAGAARTRGAPQLGLQPLLSGGAPVPRSPRPRHAHAGRQGRMGGCGGAQRGGRAARGRLRGAMATARLHAHPGGRRRRGSNPQVFHAQNPLPTFSRGRSPSGIWNPVIRTGGGAEPRNPGGCGEAEPWDPREVGEARGPPANPAGPRAPKECWAVRGAVWGPLRGQ